MGGGKPLRQMKYSCHAGTIKWNKNKHRLFGFITKNWRSNPLVSHQVIVQLIGSTTTDTCLQVYCEIDGNLYPKGIKVTDQEIPGYQHHARPIPRRVNYTFSPYQQPP